MRTFLLGLGVALLLASAVPALAHSATMPGEHPGDLRLSAQVSIAVNYWAARGVVGCPSGIRASFARNLLTEDGSGGAAGHGYECEIWIHAGVAHDARLPGPRWDRVYDAAMECGLVTHEVGHAFGLDHAATGVMREDIAGQGWSPRECWTWAGAYVPRRLGMIVKRPLLSVR